MFLLWTFHLYAATFQHLHMEFCSHLIQYSRALIPIKIVYDSGLLFTWKLLIQGFLLVKLRSSFEGFTVAIVTLLSITEYLCYRWPQIVWKKRLNNDGQQSININKKNNQLWISFTEHKIESVHDKWNWKSSSCLGTDKMWSKSTEYFFFTGLSPDLHHD